MKSIANTSATPARVGHLTALALAATVALWGTAHAESTPFFIGASETVSHDSNVTQAGTGNAVNNVATADTNFVTSVFAGVDQPLGRQRLHINANARDTRYRHNSRLNNQGYGFNGGLDWSTIERLSGSINASSNRNLAEFDGLNAKVEKNIETTNQFSATARLGVVTDLSFDAGYSHQNVSFSLDAYRQRENSSNTYFGGITYRPGSRLSLGISGRRTTGSYPNAIDASKKVRADDFRSNNVDFTANWEASAVSTLTARISTGKSSNSINSNLNSSGVTGALGWNWAVTSKANLSLQASRDTGYNTTFIGSSIDPGSRANNAKLSTNVSLSGNYELDSKIALRGRLGQVKRDLVGNASENVSGTDTLHSSSIGIQYKPTRTIGLGCDVSRNNRDYSGAVGLSSNYTANSYGCSASITLQP